MRKIGLAFAGAALMAASTPAAAEIVDFESLAAGDTFNPLTISGATFFTNNGFNYVLDIGDNNTLCATPTSGSPASCGLTLEVLFGQRASAISFKFLGNNELTLGADIGDVTLFGGSLGDVLLGTADIRVTDLDILSLDQVELSGFQNVTRMFITSTDFGGISYDDFSFQLAVPEPATWASMIAGFGLAGAALRRKRRPQMA